MWESTCFLYKPDTEEIYNKFFSLLTCKGFLIVIFDEYFKIFLF